MLAFAHMAFLCLLLFGVGEVLFGVKGLVSFDRLKDGNGKWSVKCLEQSKE